MSGAPGYEKKRVLITVKTYPTPAKKGVEVSCTAGITNDGKWLRLFPVPFRFLSFDKRFSKYQWIDVEVKHSSDPREESYEPNLDSIQIHGEPLTTRKKWLERKQIVLPLASPSLCHLKGEREVTGQTLGIFKPREIDRLVIRDDKPDWTADEKEKLLQHGFYHPSSKFQPLEKIPYKFMYRFRCDDKLCPGHLLSCFDWELGQAYRSWRDKYGEHWEAYLRNRFEYDMISRFDTHFYVGNMRVHPDAWIIVGLFYPPR